jgi:hypothetical protein
VIHDVAIWAHAVAATVALLVGLNLMFLSARRTPSPTSRVRFYLVGLIATVAFLVIALAVEWDEITTGERISFSALSLLALVMVLRGARGSSRFGAQDAAPVDHLDDIAFTVIALFDGFVIVAAIDLGLPVWVVVLVAVAGVIAGIRVKQLAHSSIRPDPTAC